MDKLTEEQSNAYMTILQDRVKEVLEELFFKFPWEIRGRKISGGASWRRKAF